LRDKGAPSLHLIEGKPSKNPVFLIIFAGPSFKADTSAQWEKPDQKG
jgi:hypothetical protein